MPAISFSGGYSFKVTRLSLSEEIGPDAFTAAPEAWATVSGMSLGDEKTPLTKTPALEVSKGVKILVEQYPYSFRSTPNFFPNSCISSEGSSPTESTTKLNTSSLSSPSSVLYTILRSLVMGSSSMWATRHLVYFTPYSFFARS